MHLRNVCLIGLTSACVTAIAPASAEEIFQGVPPPATPTPWIGELSLGYVQTRGNSDTSTLNVKAGLEYRGEIWSNAVSAFLLRGSQDNTTTDERYSLANKLDYRLGSRSYLFGNAAYDNDRFGGVAERYALTTGYGRHVLVTANHALDVEIGVGANRTRAQDEPDFDFRSIYTVGGKYLWKITETSQFSQTLRTEIASNNTYINPISELKLTIVGSLYTVIAYEFRYNTKVPDGTRHLDQIATVNLGYGFGKK